MVDGIVEVSDLAKTESNRTIVESFVNEVLIERQLEKLAHYINGEHYTEHSPNIDADVASLKSALSGTTPTGSFKIQYNKCHRILAEGNFVLSVCEGFFDGIHSSFYDLFRVSEDKLVEHWDTAEAIVPKSEWKNNNGKF